MILFPPAILNDKYGNVFESDPKTLEINCKPNGECETGSRDGICDGLADGICDPDCEETGGYDPDCQTPAPTSSFLVIALAVAIIIIVAITLSGIVLRRRKKG